MAARRGGRRLRADDGGEGRATAARAMAAGRGGRRRDARTTAGREGRRLRADDGGEGMAGLTNEQMKLLLFKVSSAK